MIKFVNAQEMHKKYPDTFEAPTKKEMDAQKVGNSVKVCHNDERFWVTITAIKGNTIKGTVDNDLYRSHPFKYGDIIEFKKYNIFHIYS